MSNKLITIGIIFFISLVLGLSGCNEQQQINQKDSEEITYQNGDHRLVSTEQIGGPYDLQILHMQNYYDGTWYNYSKINYTKQGISHEGILHSFMTEALEWLKENTSVNSTILCWWDYGHMIEGVAERNALATYPSLALKHTMAEFSLLDEAEKKDFIKTHRWDSNKTLEDVAFILTTENLFSNHTQKRINEYNISYILTRSYDSDIARIFFDACGKNSSAYVTEQKIFTDKGKSTLIFDMWTENPDMNGLELVYSFYSSGSYDARGSQNVRIFKIIK
jgi:hypothetical protein